MPLACKTIPERLHSIAMKGHHAMIRVALFDDEPGVKVVEFDAIPLEREADFRCDPEGLLSFYLAQELASELQRGDVEGWVAGYRWHRLAGGEATST